MHKKNKDYWMPSYCKTLTLHGKACNAQNICERYEMGDNF